MTLLIAAALQIARPRFYATPIDAFAAVAMVIATVGLHAIISYSVTRRTREIGIRVALGARPAAIRRMIVPDAMALSGVGIAIGALGALVLNRSRAVMLFGVEPVDPATYVVAGAAFAAVAFIAASLAAAPVLRVDPVVALRAE